MRYYRAVFKRSLSFCVNGAFDRPLSFGVVILGALILIGIALADHHIGSQHGVTTTTRLSSGGRHYSFLRSVRRLSMSVEYDREQLSAEAGLPIDGADELSEFDKELQERWNQAMHKQYFRYKLGELKYRKLNGSQMFVAMSNRSRGALRRPPEPMTNIHEPFDPDKFHFGKIKARELLLKMYPKFRWHSKDSQPDTDANNDIIINDSPIDHGHVLLVPHRLAMDGSPQSITEYGLRYAVDLFLLSRSRNWIVVFNSLCALASVNHLHFQAMYTKTSIPVQNWHTEHLENSLYRLDDRYHSFGFLVSWRGNSEQLTLDVLRVVKVLNANSIAHNVVMVRGQSVSSALYPGLLVPRVIIFPRKHFLGAKQQSMHFNVAALELAGLLLHYGSDEEFESLTEEAALETLREARLDKDVLEKLTIQVTQEFVVPTDSTDR
ncbi:GDP-D-glucose phosphorylase 1-like [Sycon ciliatum]|uniref:GDP-D-glucose phosphorylase 1-like n=1 Tax=Sycon ciliatum TaxID=27933 RepID=UPI0020AC95D0|eukprot:scpid60446/ scgid25615/ GDP-D-glucose phosphorylase C15orf58 homolog